MQYMSDLSVYPSDIQSKEGQWERNLAQPGRDEDKSHASPTATLWLGPLEGTPVP